MASICGLQLSKQFFTFSIAARFHTAWVQTVRTRIEQMSSAVHPITDIRQCYLAHCQLGGPPYFFKQLANRHDAHAAKIISFLQNYECCIIV
jgi:hypothetical protein